jgi:hypothetical protein
MGKKAEKNLFPLLTRQFRLAPQKKVALLDYINDQRFCGMSLKNEGLHMTWVDFALK